MKSKGRDMTQTNEKRATKCGYSSIKGKKMKKKNALSSHSTRNCDVEVNKGAKEKVPLGLGRPGAPCLVENGRPPNAMEKSCPPAPGATGSCQSVTLSCAVAFSSFSRKTVD